MQLREVPCNGCTLCCQGDAIRLEDAELSMGYKTEPHPYVSGALMLAHSANGNCVYLGEGGCTIHDRSPLLCRSADCRSIAAKIDFVTAKRLHVMGRLDLRVWDQGHKLLASGEESAQAKKT
ncbi:MAG TPA: YkgJ family cysteine cluster protein [Bacteroidota bacterium]|nr:YkgJ family cysteine cluster protein [Bacteroidota bacterium]